MNKDIEKAIRLLKREVKYYETSSPDALTGIKVRLEELETVVKNCSIPLVSSCYAVIDEEDNVVQLYQTEKKANEGLNEFRNSHPHTTFYVDTMQIN